MGDRNPFYDPKLTYTTGAVTGDDYLVSFGIDTVITPAYIEFDTTIFITENILPDTCDVMFDDSLGWLAVNCIEPYQAW